MKNNTHISQLDDILDFLDEAMTRKALNRNNSFDIVDIVKAFFDQENCQKIKETKNGEKENSYEALTSKTLSTMARISVDQEADLEKYQYLYEERAAIIQFEWLPIEATSELSESEAFKEVAMLYAAEKRILINSPAVAAFINQLITQ
jgi:hypothetical protein